MLVKVTVIEKNPYFGKVDNVCELDRKLDVWINLEKITNKDYDVTILNEFGERETCKYKLNAPQSALIYTPSYPLRIMYYNDNNKRLYLIDDGWWLEKIEK